MKKENFSLIEVFVVSLFFFPAYSATLSLAEFGQPFIYGFLVERQFYLILTGPLLLYALRKDIISLLHIKQTFLLLSWSSLLVYTVLYFTISPESYDKLGSFVRSSEVKGEPTLAFRVEFIVFGLFYYMIKLFETKRNLSIIPIVLFFSYLAVLQMSRIMLLSVLITVSVYFIKNVSHILKSKYFARFLMIYMPMIFTIVFATMIVKPEFLRENTDRYTHMYQNVLFTLLGQETDESSASTRLYEFEKATQYILKNPVFGSGRLSNQWKGGYERLFGHYYPSDIGVIGVIFLYGVFGLIIINLQYLLAYYYSRKIKHFKNDTFLMACKYFLLFIFIRSVPTASTFVFSAISIIIIFIIYYYCYIERNLSKKELEEGASVHGEYNLLNAV